LPGSKRLTRRIAATLCATALLSASAGALLAQPAGGGAAELVVSAIGLLGTPYRFGGDQPSSGFDCSGLVRYVARNVLGLQLPRQAEAISRAGAEVDPQRLQPGDLVFFNTLGRPFSHVGFYVGDGQFVHAPTRRGQVRIERMSQPYWRSRFNGARRLEVPGEGETASVSTVGAGAHGWAADADFGNVKP
jgi:cell wall-associated NlpC family hydrolase